MYTVSEFLTCNMNSLMIIFEPTKKKLFMSALSCSAFLTNSLLETCKLLKSIVLLRANPKWKNAVKECELVDQLSLSLSSEDQFMNSGRSMELEWQELQHHLYPP